jgi:hypothetical protein
MTRCNFAWPGTYGHECGKPAVLAGARTSLHMASGIYFVHRCAEHAEVRGGENVGVKAWEPLDLAKHKNDFNGWRN